MDNPHAIPSVGSSLKSLELTEVAEEIAIVRDAYESSLRVNETNRLLQEPGIYATDANGRMAFINAAAIRMTGWKAKEVLGQPEHLLVNRDRPDGALLPDAMRITPVQREENSTFLRKDGTGLAAACTGTSIRRHGKLLGRVIVFRDLSISRGRQKWVQSENAIFSAIIAHHPLPSTMQLMADAFVDIYAPKAIAIFVLSGDKFHIAAEAGLPPRSVPPVAGRASLPHARSRGRSSQPGSSPERSLPGGSIQQGLFGQGEFQQESGVSGWPVVASEVPDGAARSCPAFQEILETGVKLCLASPLSSASGEAKGVVTVFDAHQVLLDDAIHETIRSLCDLGRMAIEHRQLYEQVIQRSFYDLLTGLPNRRLLEDLLRQATVAAKFHGRLVAVCCIDLDRFKQVNDALGHEMGDACLKVVSEALKAAVREIDILAREGGDEFIFVLTDLERTSDAANICQRLLKALSAPMMVDGHELTINANIGISIFPDHGESPDLLLRNADMALVEAKRMGRGQAQIYSPVLGRQHRRAAEMADALLVAVAQSEFHLAYQPIYNMHREIAGLEALLRWKHPVWGRVNPLEFIPTAERTGLIVPIGDWVIEEVCRQAMAWNAADIPPVKMFANVSGLQLGQANFSSKIEQTLQRSGLAPNRLELEITESWFISDLRGAAGRLQKLRDVGIGIAIDDFGTGHSTFKYLQELPIDTLKIDRSFIHRLDGSAVNLSTVRAITGLAQQLGLKTVAEGVESEQQLIQLAELGCELAQGFFLARPLTPEAAGTLLMKQSIPRAARRVALAHA
jgi:diguanylate cyclase (GGDEF)-like protein/PAS domain S-box-containing protein